MSERSSDPIIRVLDTVLQAFIGERTTRPDAGPSGEPQVFRDFSGMIEIDECMSNCDHTIDDGMAEQLRAAPGQVYSRHAAWNFNGKVWFENGTFYEEVWVYCTPRETLSAPSLRELMDVVNAKYGSE